MFPFDLAFAISAWCSLYGQWISVRLYLMWISPLCVGGHLLRGTLISSSTTNYTHILLLRASKNTLNIGIVNLSRRGEGIKRLKDICGYVLGRLPNWKVLSDELQLFEYFWNRLSLWNRIPTWNLSKASIASIMLPELTLLFNSLDVVLTVKYYLSARHWLF